MYYFVIEHDVRPDGVVNTSENARSSFAQGLAYFYEKCSKAPTSEVFVSVHIMLVDESLNIIKKEDIPTMYVAPTEEAPTEGETEATE